MSATVISVPAPPNAVEKPSNKAIKSVSILVAIELPRTVPSSSAGLPAPIAATSVSTTCAPTSPTVMVTDEVETVLLLMSVPSVRSAAVTAGYFGT